MRTLHTILHLQHRQHTGRLLQHKHTSYRGLAVIIGLAGICMVGFGIMARATADSLYVYARIAAPIPSGPPVITFPANGTTTDKANVTVYGTCPVVTPHVVIVLLDNGNQIGSAPCDANNNFHILIALDAGQNILTARPYTITGDPGPDSAPVMVIYTPTVPPPAATSISSSNTKAPSTLGAGPTPLVLTANMPFITFGPQKNAVWLGSISGGTPPYKLTIDWDDGTTETYHINQPGQQSYEHHYRFMQPSDVTVQVRDTDGQIITRHYAAVTPYLPPAASLFSTKPNSLPIWAGPRVIGIYGVYLMVLAGFGWLWLRANAPVYAHAHVRTGRRPVRSRKRR